MWETEWTMYISIADYEKFLYGVLTEVEPYPDLAHPSLGESYGFRTVRYAPGSR